MSGLVLPYYPPSRLTEKFIGSQIEFHRNGRDHYRHHGQEKLERWSQSMAAEWERLFQEKFLMAFDDYLRGRGRARARL